MRQCKWMVGNKHNQTHGMCKTKTYASWVAMIGRCTRPSQDRYKNYGGRGIKVCEEWMTFANFYADMGKRPSGKTLDRIDVNGDYKKSNCRWADSYTQYRNMAKSRFLTLRGHTKILSDWAREFGTTNTAIHHYLNSGRDLETMYSWRVAHGKKVPSL